MYVYIHIYIYICTYAILTTTPRVYLSKCTEAARHFLFEEYTSIWGLGYHRILECRLLKLQGVGLSGYTTEEPISEEVSNGGYHHRPNIGTPKKAAEETPHAEGKPTHIECAPTTLNSIDH